MVRLFFVKRTFQLSLLLQTAYMTTIQSTEENGNIQLIIDTDGEQTTSVYPRDNMPEEIDNQLIEIFGERPNREERR